MNLHCNEGSRLRHLERRIEELDSFNYTVAHELRGPLQAIAGFARNIELNDSDNLSPKARSRLRRVVNAVTKMERLIDDLLVLARCDHASLRKEAVDSGELVREVLRDLKTAYPATRVVVSELPIIDADPTLARQVFTNVIGNALKFSALAVEPLVKITLDLRGAFIVRDNGIGFPMDKAEALFEPFERLSRDPAYPGTGVGLAVAQKLVRLHGGWIMARSREGGPTEFRLSFGPA